MNPESEEKKKNSPLNRKFLLRGVVICVFLALLPFAGIQAWKQSRFFFYKNLWEQNYPGDYLVYHTYSENRYEQLHSTPISDDEVWGIAEECLRNFACEITYSEEHYLPEFIRFNNASEYWLRTFNVWNCAELPPDRNGLQSDCRWLGFEPITNNE